MALSQFSLLWSAHKNNICSGLSALQQNGEFVDMTLAADGHLVKVHQVIIALASPYLKELIASAQCPHPVIFLNKISYTTLSAILEYIYTGEVVVSIEHLNELLTAGKELHITGLQDMKPTTSMTSQSTHHVQQNDNDNDDDNDNECTMESLDDDICYFEVSNIKGEVHINSEESYEDSRVSRSTNAHEEHDNEDLMVEEGGETILGTDSNSSPSTMQYTVSNQGSLQMILNRYMYYLKHANRNNVRQWRCVDYLNNTKCPAHVFTKNDTVLQRISAHIHPFHDKRILKKVQARAVFSAISEAQKKGRTVAKSLLKKSE